MKIMVTERTESSLPPFRTKTNILKIQKFTPSRSRYFFTTSPSGSGRKGVSDGTSNGVWEVVLKGLTVTTFVMDVVKNDTTEVVMVVVTGNFV